MKHRNRKHLNMLYESVKENPEVEKWSGIAHGVSNTFCLDQERIGVLSIEDLVQFAYLGIYITLQSPRWIEINEERPDEDHKGYMTMCVKNFLQMCIRTEGHGVRISARKREEMAELWRLNFSTDDTIPRTKYKYHEAIVDDKTGTRLHDADALGITLMLLIEKSSLSELEKDLILLTSGIDDQDKIPLKELSLRYGKSVNTLSQMKRRALKKLRTNENAVFIQKEFSIQKYRGI